MIGDALRLHRYHSRKTGATRVAPGLSSLARRSAGFLAVLPAAVGLILASATSAHATQAQPPTDWSFYITTPNTTTAYNWGCSQGNFDRTHGNVDSENILDFGAQDSAGTKLVNGTYITKAQLEAVVEQWARGYYVCTDGDTTSTNYLAIGTNNSIPSVLTTGYGQAWAHIVSDVQAWLSNNSIGQVVIRAANDMEPAWADHSLTGNWVAGYASINPAFYINYGSADGCPSSTANNGACANGWHQTDVWWVSWYEPPALSAPEIYFRVQSQQWTMIALYAATYRGSYMRFQGPLDEYDVNHSTLTSTAAWNYFWSDLNSRSSTAQNMLRSMEIHYE